MKSIKYRFKIVFTICLLFSLLVVSCSVRVRPASGQTPCPSGVWVQAENGQPICQPQNTDRSNDTTLYATYHFGMNAEYSSISSAASTARDKLGNRPVSIHCDKRVWESDLNGIIAQLDTDTIFGIAKADFCKNGGYIETWPKK